MFEQKLSEAERENRVKEDKINELTKQLLGSSKEDELVKQYQSKMQLLEVSIQKKVAAARQEMEAELQAKFDSELNQVKTKYKQELATMILKPQVAEKPAP